MPFAYFFSAALELGLRLASLVTRVDRWIKMGIMQSVEWRWRYNDKKGM